jgi:glycosyltransferase involved in cell wall biosynthesis
MNIPIKEAKIAIVQIMKDSMPNLIFRREFATSNCKISVVMPLFNQEEIIIDVLTKVIKSVKSSFELIIINDCSTDSTLERIVTFASNDFKNSSLSKLEIYSNDYPRFETFCDHFGFSRASGEFLLEIQADMFVDDPGFDIRMIQAFTKYGDIFALSGRGTHDIDQVVDVYRESLGTDRAYASNLVVFMSLMFKRRIIGKISRILNFRRYSNTSKIQVEPKEATKESHPLLEIFPTPNDFKAKKQAGLLGDLIEISGLNSGESSRKIFFGETVMRGPLMLRADTYHQLGGLNVNSFYQGFDDHELMLQAWTVQQKRCAYIPVYVTSILSQGTTRKPRSFKSDLEILFKTVKISRKRKDSLLYKLSRGTQISLPNFEIRDF